MAQPQSTRVVRQESGAALRDGEDDVFELPTNLTKRGLYERFCNDRGWGIKTTANGYAKPTKIDDDAKTIYAFGKFYSFWKSGSPKLRLGKSSEDVCTSWHVFCSVTK